MQIIYLHKKELIRYLKKRTTKFVEKFNRSVLRLQRSNLLNNPNFGELIYIQYYLTSFLTSNFELQKRLQSCAHVFFFHTKCLFFQWLLINEKKYKNAFFYFPQYMNYKNRGFNSCISVIMRNFKIQKKEVLYFSFDKWYEKRIKKFLNFLVKNLFLLTKNCINIFLLNFKKIEIYNEKIFNNIRVFYPFDSLLLGPLFSYSTQYAVQFAASPSFLCLKATEEPGLNINSIAMHKNLVAWFKYDSCINHQQQIRFVNKPIPYFGKKFSKKTKIDLCIFYEHLEDLNHKKSLLNDLYTNNPHVNFYFLFDIIDSINKIKKILNIYIKGKRNLRIKGNKIISQRIKFFEVLASKSHHNFKFLNPDYLASDIIKNSECTIAIPFSTPGFLAQKLGKKFFFYDTLSICKKANPQHIYKLVYGRENLERKLKNIFQ